MGVVDSCGTDAFVVVSWSWTPICARPLGRALTRPLAGTSRAGMSFVLPPCRWIVRSLSLYLFASGLVHSGGTAGAPAGGRPAAVLRSRSEMVGDWRMVRKLSMNVVALIVLPTVEVRSKADGCDIGRKESSYSSTPCAASVLTAGGSRATGCFANGFGRGGGRS